MIDRERLLNDKNRLYDSLDCDQTRYVFYSIKLVRIIVVRVVENENDFACIYITWF